MDTQAAVFEVNEPMVISETIDGETVIINLEYGTYYSLKQVGAIIWTGIQARRNVSDIAGLVQAHFDVEAGRAAAEVAELVRQLSEEQLVRPASGAAGGETGAPLPAPAARASFVPPALEKFTDMEAMLLLDPVHDVDEEGWPHLPGKDGQANA
ncbi:MAG TPA: PqqD family protein [Bauldia sp.]|nr:PqqD family protein [Bauldia sp.]